MSELREKVKALIDECGLREGELFEKRYPKQHRIDGAFYDTTEIHEQAAKEYADFILAAFVETVEGMEPPKCQYAIDTHMIVWGVACKAQKTAIVQKLKEE